MLKHVVEVSTDALSILIKETLSRNHSNSLENLNSQSSSRNCPNNIDSVLFTFNVVSPSVENVAAFVDVDVILSAADKSFVCHS